MPFTVAESKILMMAKESEDLKTVIDAIRQILKNCLVDKSIEINSLPMIDLEWLFLHIYARSQGEKQPLFFKCTNEPVAGHPCGMILEFQIDLLQVGITNKDVNRKIQLDDNSGMVMRLPTFEISEKVLAQENNNEDIVLAALCIESVWDAQSIYNTADATEEEVMNFVESLPPDKFDSILSYLNNCPSIHSEHQILCEKCNFHHKITLEGLEEHFT
jgi:hypothetical protein